MEKIGVERPKSEESHAENNNHDDDQKNKVELKCLAIAYCLWLPPFGLMGCHRLYTGQNSMAFYYFLTGGNVGLGWAMDFFRLPALVRSINESATGTASPHWFDLLICLLPPMGLLGAARAFLGYATHAAAYFFTGGGLGLLYLIDFFRIPTLLAEAQAKEQQEALGYRAAGQEEQTLPEPKEQLPRLSVAEAYLLAFIPTGFLGFHRFYMGHFWVGLLWFLTGAGFGLGWLYDMAHMDYLINEANIARGYSPPSERPDLDLDLDLDLERQTEPKPTTSINETAAFVPTASSRSSQTYTPVFPPSDNAADDAHLPPVAKLPSTVAMPPPVDWQYPPIYPPIDSISAPTTSAYND